MSYREKDVNRVTVILCFILFVALILIAFLLVESKMTEEIRSLGLFIGGMMFGWILWWRR